MTNKTIMIGLVAIAFVAGSIMTGNTANAGTHNGGGNEFLALLMELETQIISMQTQIQQLDFLGEKGETGDKGPDGDKGATGDTGDQGPVGTFPSYYVASDDVTGSQVGTAFCDSGDIATGGGIAHVQGTFQAITASIPAISGGVPIGWTAAYSGSNAQNTVWAVCADIAEPFR